MAIGDKILALRKQHGWSQQQIEAGIEDSDQGRTLDVKEVRKRFGLTP